MTGIDIVIAIRALLNVSSVTSLLGGGKVWQHNRPQNSEFTDVVISVPEFNGSGGMNTGFVDVNIHSHNLREYYPISGEPQDNTFPNFPLLKTVTDAVVSLLVSSGTLSLTPRIIGIPIRDKDGHWYVNIRVAFEVIDAGKAISIELKEEDSTADGYGGSTVTLVQKWSGKAVQQNIAGGSQLAINAGRYEFNLRCDWLIPKAQEVQKYMQIHTAEGKYVINGIIPDGDFWRVSTVRKDGNY